MARVTGWAAIALSTFALAGACAAASPSPGPTAVTAAPPPGPDAPGPLRVDGRFLADSSGAPFFWMGDTAWGLPALLDRAETERYLDERAAQGYNLVQVVAIFPHAGADGPNRYGDRPYSGGLDDLGTTEGADPADEQAYDYWDHLDFVVDAAAARGIRVGMLPVWADKQVGKVVTEDNARAYGEFVGARYRDRVVWVLGGDESADGVEEVWNTLAGGIEAGAGREVLMTYHPIGDKSSAEWFSGQPWLDLNMVQGGHCLRYDVRRTLVEKSYRADPALPFVDGEPIYEEHPYCWERAPEGFSTALDVRRDAYWAVFGGALGHTYGHHNVWQFQTPDRKGALGSRPVTWQDALQAPGAAQMTHLRALMESRPFTTGEPAPDAVPDPGKGENRIQATRARDGAYLMAYVPDGREFTVDLSTLSGPARAWWFDPRSGEATPAEVGSGRVTLTPPDDEDWVLVADDAARGFPAPGSPA